ncbi:MAG TPA: flagellar biosynthesis anti-sigma factor FlgM [Bryobacteraceae bacterium]|jgi:flagellar biosynthesis anti-sigma factor FlgM|nr:flagellar biosynthesis anti-sigma factor FlgM [Bryobacteraceae bacterium]
MRIFDNNAAAVPGPDRASRSSANPASGPKDQPPKSAPDGLRLSGFAGALSQLSQSDSANRVQRVAELKAAVQSGSYNPDSEAIAKAIVSDAVSTALPNTKASI